MELSSSNIKKFLIFSQKKTFLIFRETETPKKSFYFRKWNFLLFQETGTPEKTSYIPGSNFPSFKNKKIHSEKVSYISGNGTF